MKNYKDLNYGINGGESGYTTCGYKKHIKRKEDFHRAEIGFSKGKRCIECFYIFSNYSVISNGPMKGTRIEKPDVCQVCISKGWLNLDSQESIKELEKDKEFNSLILRESHLIRKID